MIAPISLRHERVRGRGTAFPGGLVDRLQRKLIVRYANEQIRQINKLSVSSNWMKFLENRRNRTASEER